MQEKPFYFSQGNYQLFGVVHNAINKVKHEGFVLCAPFAEEKLWANRVLLNFARELASRGYHVLRFDYMGNGDSDGNFEESTLQTMLSDVKCAVKTLREKNRDIDTVNLLGLRMGASIAALAAKEETDIKRLILWEPIIDGTGYTRELLRINLSTQASVYRKILYNTDMLIEIMKRGGTVNVDGYEMAWPLYEQIANVNLLNQENSFHGDVLIVQICRNTEKVNPAFIRLKECYSKGELAVTMEEPFWKEIRHYYYRAINLYNVTFEWL